MYSYTSEYIGYLRVSAAVVQLVLVNLMLGGIARALFAIWLLAARRPFAEPRLVAHWPVPARRLLRRRHPRRHR